ncbi:DUF401 family protein [Desulfoplanes formicivorans]|uniref:DUF401 family protein n=1 Tax=Desulfoplanes formicivorans TaxID=1592317 RepID=A0A194AG76_9BACT|nr:DUF401 family protein [Desulfoplanes formicivorans]GAU08210.1 hypothetical protein DPF_0913 [Desulfoplanes formicivorans]
MDTIAPIIPFAKVLLAFAVMLAGMRFKLSLGVSILTGGIVLGLLFGIAPMTIGQAGARALVGDKFLFLVAIVGLILMLSDALERSGQSKRLMDALAGYLTSPRLRLIFFPALIGLLPMPGGAVFSAPMVGTVSEDLHISSRDKALINYWFRHIWELGWPLYPGVILTVALADIPIGALISRTWPAIIFMLGAGWIFFLRPGVLKVDAHSSFARDTHRSPSRVLVQGLPLLVAIVGAVGLESLIPIMAPKVPFELGVITALIASVACIMVQNHLGRAFLIQVLTKKSLRDMLLVVASVFIFKEIMEAAQVVEAMARAAGGDAALFAASVFLPFLVGAIAGINVAFVGSTFPLLLGLLNTLGMQGQMIPYIVLASFAGFTGVMISPIHICFILTCQFFHTELAATWRRLVPPCLLFAFLGTMLFFLLQWMS